MTTDKKALAERIGFMVADGRHMGVNEMTINLDVLEEAAAALTASPQVDEGRGEVVATVVTVKGQNNEVGPPCVLLEPSYENWLDQQPPGTSHRLYTTPQPQGDSSGQVFGGGECNCPNGRAEHAPGCAALSPTQARPECRTCNDRGEVYGHVGQTPESFDYFTEPCPDCSKVAEPAPTAAGGAVAWCALNAGGGIAYFDGKPMIMVGAVGNVHHTVPMFLHPAPKTEVARLVEAVQELLESHPAAVTYPDGPCIERQARDELQAAIDAMAAGGDQPEPPQ